MLRSPRALALRARPRNAPPGRPASVGKQRNPSSPSARADRSAARGAYPPSGLRRPTSQLRHMFLFTVLLRSIPVGIRGDTSVPRKGDASDYSDVAPV